MTPTRPRLVLAYAALLVALPVASQAQAQAQPQVSGPAAAAKAAEQAPPTGFTTRSLSLPAKGLFQGDQLSAAARARLDEMIIDAVGLDIEVALVTPVGPWNVDGSAADERALTPARLAAVRRYLAERGVDTRKVYVESRLDERVKEPRLDVQVGGRPARD